MSFSVNCTIEAYKRQILCRPFARSDLGALGGHRSGSGIWVKLSHHTKQNRTEHLPLLDSALALLAEMRARAGAAQQYLFPGNSPDKPLQGIQKFWRSLTKQ